MTLHLSTLAGKCRPRAVIEKRLNLITACIDGLYINDCGKRVQMYHECELAVNHLIVPERKVLW